MAMIDAVICLPFQQAQDAVRAFQQKTLEACLRTQFPYGRELQRVVSDLEALLVPLVLTRQLSAVTVAFGTAAVCFTLRYDAEPEEEDTLDISALDLVVDVPEEATLTIHLRDKAKAAFLGAANLSDFATAHVRIIQEAMQNDGAKEDRDGSAG